MHMILLFLGVVSVAAGVGMVIFGIPDSAFGLGNTLIMSGVFAIIGGFVLVGLGSIVSQLRRIREAIEAQQLGASGRPERPVALDDPVRPPVLAAPPSFGDDRPTKPRPAEVAVAEPRPGPPGTLGLKDPLTGTSVAAPSEPAVASPGIAPDVRVTPEPIARKTEWPHVDSADRTAHEAVRPRDLSGAASPREAVPPAPSSESTPEPVAAAPTILKSGVIEGMAYTLYSDGSIEAELARGGMMRFGSIPELRAYLRDNP